jgi:O-antigen ligase
VLVSALRTHKLPAIAVAMSLFAAFILTLAPSLFLVLTLIMLAGLALLCLRIALRPLSLPGLLAVMSVVLVSGFGGTFADTSYVIAMNSLARWIAPLGLTLAAIYNCAALPLAAYWRGQKWRQVSIPLLLFTLFAVLSSWYSPFTDITFGRAISFLMITTCTAIALFPTLNSRYDIEKIARTVAVLMGGLLLLGLPFVFFPGSVGWLGGRYRSTWGNPVGLSHISALLIPTYIWLMTDRRLAKGWRSIAGVVVFCLAVNIFLSQSRSGVIGLTAACGVLLLTVPTVKWRIAIIATAIVALGCGFAAVGAGACQDFITRGYAFDDPSIASGRALVWQAAYASWQSSPLVGHGFGTGGDPLVNQDLLLITGAARTFSLYLELLATLGIVGFLLLLWVFALALRSLTIGLVTARGDAARFIALALSIFACGLVLNVTETWIISAGSPFAAYWWLMLILGIRMVDLEPVGP